MTKPNILILMVDQLNGTLFPDGPADWLHAPALKALAWPDMAPARRPDQRTSWRPAAWLACRAATNSRSLRRFR